MDGLCLMFDGYVVTACYNVCFFKTFVSDPRCSAPTEMEIRERLVEFEAFVARLPGRWREQKSWLETPG